MPFFEQSELRGLDYLCCRLVSECANAREDVLTAIAATKSSKAGVMNVVRLEGLKVRRLREERDSRKFEGGNVGGKEKRDLYLGRNDGPA